MFNGAPGRETDSSATGGAAALAYRMCPSPGNGIENVGWRLSKVDVDGRVSTFGRLVALREGRYRLEGESGNVAEYDGLPWFLADMRPQGFMGRAFAAQHCAPGVPLDPDHWSDAAVLRFLGLHSEVLPGNLIVGEDPRERLSAASRLAQVASVESYPSLAEAATRGLLASSLVGGEQPKFCCSRSGRQVIVKYSPLGVAPCDVRRRDLLVCEHIALNTLRGAGVPAATTHVFAGSDRIFLEIERFDRPFGGRIGLVSLMAYDAEHVGQMDNWAATARRMESLGLMTAVDAGRLRLLEAFGRLICNNDRHYGNVSLLCCSGGWCLAPAYDMLPAAYAPVGGTLVTKGLAAESLNGLEDFQAEWSEARRLGTQFWRSVVGDERISDSFRAVAVSNARLLSRGAGV